MDAREALSHREMAALAEKNEGGDGGGIDDDDELDGYGDDVSKNSSTTKNGRDGAAELLSLFRVGAVFEFRVLGELDRVLTEWNAFVRQQQQRSTRDKVLLHETHNNRIQLTLQKCEHLLNSAAAAADYLTCQSIFGSSGSTSL